MKPQTNITPIKLNNTVQITTYVEISNMSMLKSKGEKNWDGQRHTGVGRRVVNGMRMSVFDGEANR